MIAAPVQGDVDGIPKGSHYVLLKLANQCVHLPGRLQRTWSRKKPSCFHHQFSLTVFKEPGDSIHDYFCRVSLKRASWTTLPAAFVAKRVASRLSLSIKRHVDTKVTS